MEHYVEHSLPASWSDVNKGPWSFGDGGSRLSDMMMEYASVSDDASRPDGDYLQPPTQIMQQDKAPVNKRLLRPFEETLDTSSLPPQCLQEAYGAALRGATAWVPGLLQEPYLSKEPYLGGSSSVPQPRDAIPLSRPNDREHPRPTQQANPPQTWCQSYIHGHRARPAHEGTPTRAGSSGEAAPDETHGRNGPAHIVPFSGSTGDQTAHFGPSQLIHADHQQMQCQPASVPPFGTNIGVAQAQSGAAVVSGAARPRVRARRGQATDPHSIAERLRRERIAERMKALQELVPNANKTDKASMLDEIIDYVKFLQLQVKVLSMSRLGGAGAVAPFIADFPAAEGQNNLAAALGSATAFNDGMVVAERQVARLMEEDMGSAMQFLQTKGLCLMPVSLATVISSNNSRMTVGGGGQQGFSAADHSHRHAASSTSSTLASVASSGCIGGEGESKSKQ